MGLLSNQMRAGAAGAAGGGSTGFYTHQIANSVRIPAPSSTSSSNGRLTKTFGTVDSSVHWTLNFWIKRAALGGTNPVGGVRPLDIFTPRSGTSGSVLNEMFFGSSASYGAGDAFVITNTNTGAYVLSTDNLFRDTSAWYNFHIQADLDNGTASERIKIFVNGTEVSYNVDNRGSFTSLAGFTAGAWTIGDYYGYGYPIQSSFAQWAYVDGYTHPPTDFAESKNGVWIPKDLSSGITWGSAGHLLMFQDSSALGDDTSGKGNDWTTANLATHDSMKDTPTFGSSNGGNFATLGPLWNNPSEVTLSEGNLRFTASTSGIGAMSNWAVPASGKWYWEVNYSDQYSSATNFLVGIAYAKTSLTAVETADQIVYYSENGMKIVESVRTAGYGVAFDSPSGDAVVGVAVDRVNNTLNFSYNGSWQGTIDISGLSSNEFFPYTGFSGVNGTQGCTYNFGQDGTFAGNFTAQGNTDDTGYGDFKYAVPTGFLAMCAGNLPVADEVDPAQTDDDYPKKLFSPIIYTGNGGTLAVTGLGFKPDYVSIRRRNAGNTPPLYDSSRGNTKLLTTTATAAEYDQSATPGLSAFGTDGFTVEQPNTGDYGTNRSTALMVAWCQRANGGTTSTNSAGSLSVTQQVDPSGSFSISTYNGDGGTDTIGHGLSSAPTLVWIKQLNGANNWAVYAKGAGATKYAYLDTDAAFGTAAMWQNTTPSNSLVYLGDNNEVNHSGRTYVAYCFADTEGFFKSSSYVGNGNSNGPFVYTGFKPSVVYVKLVASAGDWWVEDTARDTYNPATKYLAWNKSDAEASGINIDFLSNGFKIRTTSGDFNSNAATIVYGAWAENSFKYSLAR
jgi:hypothetical protein